MRFLRRLLLTLILLAALVAGGAWFVAGRMAGPPIDIVKPEKFVGVSTPVEFVVQALATELSALTMVVEQNGKQFPVYTLGDAGVELKEDDSGVRLSQTIGKQQIPELTSGPARILVTASKPVVYGIRTASNTVIRDVEVRLERPRVSVISTHHFINHGGAEAVVYRTTPEDVTSGVLVGDVEYPGYPLSGANVPGTTSKDPAVRVAFFALRHDQDLTTPMRLFARDEAGNSASSSFDYRVFPKAFKRSRIQVSQQLLDEVVPAILQGTTEIAPEGEPIEQFVAVNSELRQKNNAKIASFAAETAPEMLWGGTVFHPFTNTGVQSAFADYRTYIYQGKEVDQQVHLGFDLASYATTPIVAANRGKGALCRRAGDLRQHGDRRSRHGCAIALRPSLLVRGEGRRHGREGAVGRPQRPHRHGARRSPALHDAGQRPHGESDRVVGRALDRGPDTPEAPWAVSRVSAGFAAAVPTPQRRPAEQRTVGLVRVVTTG
jgi:hypothetical protein